MNRGIFMVHYHEEDKSKGIETVKFTDISVEGTVSDFAMAFGTEIKKENVIWEINNNINEYYTVVNNKKGSRVEVIDNKYIRSDANNTKSDNLDELPEF